MPNQSQYVESHGVTGGGGKKVFTPPSHSALVFKCISTNRGPQGTQNKSKGNRPKVGTFPTSSF